MTPVGAYADFAAGAQVFVAGGLDAHLTTLFPPVRPRGRYLEVRFLDVQEVDDVAAIAGAFASLMYDDGHRARVLARLAAAGAGAGRALAGRCRGGLRHGGARPRPGAGRTGPGLA